MQICCQNGKKWSKIAHMDLKCVAEYWSEIYDCAIQIIRELNLSREYEEFAAFFIAILMFSLLDNFKL